MISAVAVESFRQAGHVPASGAGECGVGGRCSRLPSGRQPSARHIGAVAGTLPLCLLAIKCKSLPRGTKELQLESQLACVFASYIRWLSMFSLSIAVFSWSLAVGTTKGSYTCGAKPARRHTAVLSSLPADWHAQPVLFTDTEPCVYVQTLGGAIGAADAARLAWSLAALDALREDAAQALAPQLCALALEDSPSLVRRASMLYSSDHGHLCALVSVAVG